MPYAAREFLCADCGKPITVRAASGAHVRCLNCGIAYSSRVMTEMHLRDGDEYEKWLLASLAALSRRLEEYRQRKAYEDPIAALSGGRGGGTPTP